MNIFMKINQFISVLISIVVGLGLTRLLTGVGLARRIRELERELLTLRGAKKLPEQADPE